MGRWILMMLCGAAALAMFYPMVAGALHGDGVALFFAVVVILAVGGNLFATWSILRKQRQEAEREAAEEAAKPSQPPV